MTKQSRCNCYFVDIDDQPLFKKTMIPPEVFDEFDDKMVYSVVMERHYDTPAAIVTLVNTKYYNERFKRNNV